MFCFVCCVGLEWGLLVWVFCVMCTFGCLVWIFFSLFGFLFVLGFNYYSFVGFVCVCV